MDLKLVFMDSQPKWLLLIRASTGVLSRRRRLGVTCSKPLKRGINDESTRYPPRRAKCCEF